MKLSGKTLILFIIITLFFAIPLLFSGCAGSGGASSNGSSSGSTGSISLNINWPATKSGSKYIPTSTSSIDISLTGEGLSSASNYSYGSSQTTITINNIPLGNKTANISCKDSDSNILSNRIVSFLVEAGKTTNVSANLGVTITDTGFTPQNITITPGNNFVIYK